MSLSRPLAFLAFNVFAGPAVLTAPVIVLGTLFNPYTPLLLIWIYGFGAPIALVFAVAVWPSIARTGAISLPAGVLGCALAACLGPPIVFVAASRWKLSAAFEPQVPGFILGLFPVNIIAATLMADLAHKVGILVKGPVETNGPDEG